MRAVAARRGLMTAGAVAIAVGAMLLAGAVEVGASGGAGPPRPAEEVPVTAMDLNAGFANNSPNVVADPTERRFVVIANRLDAPDFSCALQVSGDGGRTFRPARPVPELPEGAEKCYAPEVAFDRDGTLYYLFVGLEGAGNQPMGAFLTTSTDRARTFSPPVRVLGPLNFAVRMAIDPEVGRRGRIHLVWLHARTDPPLGGFGPPPNPIMAAHSDDGGRTFSPPVQVSDEPRPRVVGPALVLGPSGTVHVVYYDLEEDDRDYRGLEGSTYEGTWSIVLATSTDGGRRFGPGVVVDDAIVPDGRVMLIFTMPPPAVVAGDDGRLCVAWTDARSGDPDAVLRCSSDGARRWERLRRLNDDRMANGRRQYLPRLGLAPDGRLDAVFYDRRADDEDILNDVFYTYSTDGGRSFHRNLRLTSSPSNTLVGQRYAIVSARGMVEIGSRLGLLSRGHDVVAAWADTRNSRSGTSQDVFATVVDFDDGGQPAWARVAGGVLAAVGLAVVAAGLRRGRAA